MKLMNRLLAALILLGIVGLLAGCGDTWEGLKKDTSDNMVKSGNAIKKAGKSLSSD
ncbi:MAG: hypothetical protein JKX94_03310 [Sneathiella sp.]|nr:hypothetical protein [Sneathiella sp.]